MSKIGTFMLPDIRLNPAYQTNYPAMVAAANGDIAFLRMYSQILPNALSRKGPDGFEPLIVAAFYNQEASIRYLLEKGIEADVQDLNERTPLYWAAYQGHKKAAKCLLAAKSDINIKDASGLTPLMIAIEKGHTELAIWLVENGANLTFEEGYESSALHRAIQNNNPRLAVYLIEHGAPVDALNEQMESPLVLAISKDQFEVVDALIKHQANLNATYHTDDSSPLNIAVALSRNTIARRLISCGAHITITNSSRMTPLHTAALYGNNELLNILLINAPGLIDTQNIFNETPLTCVFQGYPPQCDLNDEDGKQKYDANISRRHDAIRALTRRHANTDLFDLKNETPLMKACKRGDLNAVRILLEKGADPDILDSNNLSCLHVAVALNDTAMIDLLCEHHADIEHIDSRGYSPLILALLSTNYEALERLLIFGANPDLGSVDGLLPLSLSIQRLPLRFSSLLLEYTAEVNGGIGQNRGQPMITAFKSNNYEGAELLLEHGAPSYFGGYMCSHYMMSPQQRDIHALISRTWHHDTLLYNKIRRNLIDAVRNTLFDQNGRILEATPTIRKRDFRACTSIDMNSLLTKAEIEKEKLSLYTRWKQTYIDWFAQHYINSIQSKPSVKALKKQSNRSKKKHKRELDLTALPIGDLFPDTYDIIAGLTKSSLSQYPALSRGDIAKVRHSLRNLEPLAIKMVERRLKEEMKTFTPAYSYPASPRRRPDRDTPPPGKRFKDRENLPEGNNAKRNKSLKESNNSGETRSKLKKIN